MNQNPDDLYGEDYYANYCGAPYTREKFFEFFDRIAECIVERLHPASALDAGCAKGFLVESLRSRGVDAWGVDVSSYAIQKVSTAVRPYCWRGSIVDPLPRRYASIVSIEVLEHLPAPEGKQAIANLCRFSNNVLFSSTPYDKRETTHFNVQTPETWALWFAECGFSRDAGFDATFITPWAMLFCGTNMTKKEE